MPRLSRSVLPLTLSCLVVIGAAGTLRGLPDEAPFALQTIGAHTWAAISNPKSKTAAVGNGGFVIGDDGVVVIDSFVNAEAATALLGEIRKLTPLPVKFVVNTHYHRDHVTGNAVFAAAGATVLAHQNVRAWIRPENLRLAGEKITPEQKAVIDALAPPTLVYEQGVDLYLGSRQVRAQSRLGHTGGDTVVLIPHAKVAFLGDLFWRKTLPNLVDASTQPWIATLDALVKDYPDYTFVPGHGDVGTAQDVSALREYLNTLRTWVADGQKQGQSGRALVDAILPTLLARYGTWGYVKNFSERNIIDVEAELNGTKRTPGAVGGGQDR